MKQQQRAPRDPSRRPADGRLPATSVAAPAAPVRPEPLEARALFSGGAWASHGGARDFGSHDAPTSATTASTDLHASQRSSDEADHSSIAGRSWFSGRSSVGSVSFQAVVRDGGFGKSGSVDGPADARNLPTASSSASENAAASYTDAPNHFGHFRSDSFGRRQDDPQSAGSDAASSTSDDSSSPATGSFGTTYVPVGTAVFTITTARPANWHWQAASLHRYDHDIGDDDSGQPDGKGVSSSSASSGASLSGKSIASGEDVVDRKPGSVTLVVTLPIVMPVTATLPVSAGGERSAFGTHLQLGWGNPLWRGQQAELAETYVDGAPGGFENVGYVNPGNGIFAGNGQGSLTDGPSDVDAGVTGNMYQHTVGAPTPAATPPAVVAITDGPAGDRRGAATPQNRSAHPASTTDKLAGSNGNPNGAGSNNSAGTGNVTVTPTAVAAGPAARSAPGQRASDTIAADGPSADPAAARAAGRGDAQADGANNGPAAARPATQIYGASAPAAPDNAGNGLSARAAALAAAARSAAANAEVQIASAGLRAIEFLRLPLAAMPMGTGGGEAGEFTDGGSGFEGLDGTVASGTLLGLAPWHVGSRPAEAKAWAWNVTAAGSLVLAVGGYWYVQAAAARRKELERATAEALAAHRDGTNARGTTDRRSPFATDPLGSMPLRDAVAATRAMVGRVDRWCRDRIEG